MPLIKKAFRFFVHYPKITIFSLLVIAVSMLFQSQHFRLDASSDTLINHHDPTFVLTQQIEAEFGSKDILIIAYRPKTGSLFDPKNQTTVQTLQAQLQAVNGIASVLSIYDLPIFDTNNTSLIDALKKVKRLRDSNLSEPLIKQTFSNHPIYSNFLISNDLSSTALLLTLDAHHPSSKDALRNDTAQLIHAIRSILKPYRSHNIIFLGGLRMITNDLVSFIKRDLVLFGSCSLLLLILTLWLIFRQIRGVVFPILTCALSLITMIGLFGTFRWEVTIISSNFISVQFILNLALCLHLMIKYRELNQLNPNQSPSNLALTTIKAKFLPCLFAALTTIAGFASLLVSNILSVTTFGWMMIVGILVSFTLSFIMFPAFMSLLPTPKKNDLVWKIRFNIPLLLKESVKRFPRFILLGSIGLFIISIIGIRQLEVENRFIDYFKDTTEIHQGLAYIDQHLGGTIPMNVVVTFDQPLATSQDADGHDDSFDEFDDFDEPDQTDRYWFTPTKIAIIKKAQHYLTHLPETGKVLSFGTALQLAEQLNNGPLDTFALNFLYEQVPPEIKDVLIKPYISIDKNQARFWVRIKDANPDLKRNLFLKNLRNTLPHAIGVRPDQISYSGALLLYNNMLQQLFQSQITTLGVVLFALFLMFWFLFRSFNLALIGIIPNLLAVLSILGLMGWLKIPLDLMTITLASISMGIAVDNTIHYMYRFKEKYETTGQYLTALEDCHATVGVVLFYTTIVIVVGFSILVLSTFVPSIYFGLMTSLAMAMALLLSLTLLPQLLIFFKPFKRPHSLQ